jgi:hypothetical protein
MGRNSTGITTTTAALKIDISYLINKGFIKKGCQISGTLYLNKVSVITIETSYKTLAGDFIRLLYTLTDRMGIEYQVDTKILLVEKPSNLGKGSIIYFECPELNNWCRILYLCYGSQVFKSRLAYSMRIYYQSQLRNRYAYAADKYSSLLRKIVHIHQSRRYQVTYNGNVTKFALRLARLKEKEQSYSEARCYPLVQPYFIRKLLSGENS